MATEYKSVLTKGNDSSLKSTPIEEGRLRFTLDTRRLFLDEASERLEITDFVKDLTEEQIRGTLAPLPKFYFSSDTHKILYYINGEWMIIAEKNDEQQFALSRNDNGTLSLTYNK